MGKGIESASGLAAYRGTDWGDRQALPAQHTQVYAKDHGTVTIPIVPAGHGADDHTPTLPRKREHVWPEIHDAFDTLTAEVDERSSGDPVGNRHGPEWPAAE
jgi:hypothetical protein